MNYYSTMDKVREHYTVESTGNPRCPYRLHGPRGTPIFPVAENESTHDADCDEPWHAHNPAQSWDTIYQGSLKYGQSTRPPHAMRAMGLGSE